MKLSALLQDVETKTRYTTDPEVTNITDDSNRIRRGGIFVCIGGSKTDGHKFARKAIDRGAVAIISEHSLDCDNCIIVENTRRTYALLCAKFYGNCHKKMNIIGITGTNGKTTTAYVLKKMLEQNGYKVGLIGTVNVIIGNEKYVADLTTPDPCDLYRYFMMMDIAHCDTCIMEVSSQALCQERVYGIDFKIGVFTNLSPEHLDYHVDMENYANAKAILMKNSSICVINADDKRADFMRKNAGGKVVTYGIDNNADFMAEKIRMSAEGVSYTMSIGKEQYNVCFDTIGKFSVYNSLAALTVGKLMGIDMDRAVRSVARFDGILGRMEKVPNDIGVNIIIDFAHTPASLENALKTLKSVYNKGKLIVVFGCGGDRDRSKRNEMGKIACENADMIFVTSDNPRTENPDAIIDEIVDGLDHESLFRIVDRTMAIKSALYSAKAGDTLLIAGKGHEKYQIKGTQKIYFNEREIVKKLLEEKARF